MFCLLCHSENCHRLDPLNQYWHCHNCDLRFLDPIKRFSASQELARYQTHNNDVHDPGYQNFVRPLVDWISTRVQKTLDLPWPSQACGLDFGCGPGPIMSYLLERQGYQMVPYDPFFADYPEHLNRTYDFVVACEVVEHFYEPLVSWSKMVYCLGAKSPLFIKTFLCTESIDFSQWSYRKDPTHVCFYSPVTIHWLQKYFGFSSVTIREAHMMKFER